MQAEIDAWLGRDNQQIDVRRDASLGNRSNWLEIIATEGCAAGTLTIFGTPEQLDAFIDRIAALRTKQPEAEQAAA